MEKSDLLNAIEFFGLEKNFSRKEFHKTFHSLALKYHPDKGEFTTDVLFIELVRYKEILEIFLENKERLSDDKNKNSKEYGIYKEGKSIESEAFLSYFKKRDGQKIKLSEKENPELKELKIKLGLAKEKLEQIIREYPNSLWAEDSKDSIHRIEIWLK